MHKQTVEIKIKPNLKGIGWDYDGQIEIGESSIDPDTGEMIIDIIPSEGAEINLGLD